MKAFASGLLALTVLVSASALAETRPAPAENQSKSLYGKYQPGEVWTRPQADVKPGEFTTQLYKVNYRQYRYKTHPSEPYTVALPHNAVRALPQTGHDYIGEYLHDFNVPRKKTEDVATDKPDGAKENARRDR